MLGSACSALKLTDQSCMFRDRSIKYLNLEYTNTEAEKMKTKKYRIKSKFRFTIFIALMVVFTAFVTGTVLGLDDASSLSEEPSYMQVEIQAGDTLWNIAGQYGPANMDRRQLVFEICRVNDINADTIQPGQTILVPEKI